MSRIPQGLGRHLVRHPLDGVALVRAGWQLRRSNWWRRAPFLPVPGEAYWDFRMTTAYGDATARPSAKDAADAARWVVRSRSGR